MSDKSERIYSLPREKAERRAAERATSSAARNIHHALADRYALLARPCRANDKGKML